MENQEKKYEIRKFIDGDIELDVRFSYDGTTVWLSANEIALLFERDVKTIRKHINNIIENKAIDESTVAKFETVQIEGNRKVTRKIEYYNLDMILAVGHKVKSNRINRFNNWVIEKLKELNNKLLLQKSLSYTNNYEIVKFESGDISLDVNVSPNEDTVWLTQREIATLFDKSISTISEHINNILVDELDEREVSKFGKTEFAGKPVTYYNLDMVLSVGYRVNSKRDIEFRKWANKILKDYLLKGYAVNNKRCLDIQIY